MTDFKQNFNNPDRRYAIYPIIHGRVAAAGEPGRRGGSFAERLDKLGYGGIVGNIPYGPGYYDGDESEWGKTEAGFREIISRGMKAWIYDEKGYPSGTAGGVVTEENPDYIVQGLYCFKYWKAIYGPTRIRSDYQDGKLFKAMLLPVGDGEPIDVTHCMNERGVLYIDVPEGTFHLFLMTVRRLFDGTHTSGSFSEPRNYISLNDKAATESFIRHTHEKYAKRLGDEFGKNIYAFFTDEPSFMSCNCRSVNPVVPWHKNFPMEFAEAYGYPIEYAVNAVVNNEGPQIIKRRCDFWEFVSESAAENFFGTIQNWCGEHNIKSSGHLMGEEELYLHVPWYGSIYKVGKRFDWPGIDALDCEPNGLMDSRFVPIGRLMASFADISGENETFTEFSDHKARNENRQISIDWVRASVNWHYAMGINNLTSYYGFDFFGDDEIIALNKYSARLGWLIRQGVRDSRVAVLYPEAAIWSVYSPGCEQQNLAPTTDVKRVSDAFASISWALLHRQVDFDYADEQLILDAEINNGALHYKSRIYECLILPQTRVIGIETLEKIRKAKAAGVGIICAGDPPQYTRDGAELDLAGEFACIPIAANGKMGGIGKLKELPRHIRVTPKSINTVMHFWSGTGGLDGGEPVSSDILSHSRLLPDGSRIIFLCNMGVKVYEGSLRAAGSNMSVANPFTGEIEPVAYETESGFVSGSIKLRPYDGMGYVIEK
ncbi:MAG: hypothetical protein FWE82_03740 [Defluviitaleaceae bacterium]|nr:hypothetical protein [Defluviitaleaceae bacterium]